MHPDRPISRAHAQLDQGRRHRDCDACGVRGVGWVCEMTMDSGPARPIFLSDLERPRRRSRGVRMLGWTFSLAAHAVALAGLLWVHADGPSQPDSPLMTASLVSLPKPDPIRPPAPANPSPARAGGRHSAVRPAPAPRETPMALQAAMAPKPDTSDLLTDAQIAGAASAGEDGGGGGGVCDMARTIQRALRRDPMVQSAVFDAHRAGKAVMVWNGDWVRSGDQDGKGLAAVREAIMWEIGFAPESCPPATGSGHGHVHAERRDHAPGPGFGPMALVRPADAQRRGSGPIVKGAAVRAAPDFIKPVRSPPRGDSGLGRPWSCSTRPATWTHRKWSTFGSAPRLAGS